MLLAGLFVILLVIRVILVMLFHISLPHCSIQYVIYFFVTNIAFIGLTLTIMSTSTIRQKQYFEDIYEQIPLGVGTDLLASVMLGLVLYTQHLTSYYIVFCATMAVEAFLYAFSSFLMLIVLLGGDKGE